VNGNHGIWWDILDTASQVIAGALAVGFGWLTKKFSEIDGRMTTMEKEFTSRNHTAETQIAVLQGYHESNTQRLDAIEDTMERVDDKLDRLIEKLSERNGRER
jgi:predicted  nucleic acid-binding Zn-ribbon protein